MDHLYWEERLQGYIDNELGPADRRAVADHIDLCPNCRSNLEYMKCLKKRLQVHAGTLRIPQTVEARIQHLFKKKRQQRRMAWMMVSGLSLVAVFLIGAFLPASLAQPYEFTCGIYEGKVICYDCEVGKKAGLKVGVLCIDRHHLGLQTGDKHLWRFADDKEGQPHIKDKNLYGKKVRVYGQSLKPARLIRIKKLEPMPDKQVLHLDSCPHRDGLPIMDPTPRLAAR
jgi:hypothetical protein